MPAELRNHIYEYAFGDAIIMIHPSDFSPSFRTSCRKPLVLDRRPVALTAVCRQLHAETRQLPFELGTFYSNAKFELSAFLSHIAKYQIDSIRHFELPLRRSSYCAACFSHPKQKFGVHEHHAMHFFSALSNLRLVEFRITEHCSCARNKRRMTKIL